MVRLFVGNILLSVVLASELTVHRDAESSKLASMPHSSLEEHTVQDYCISYGDFFCVKAEGFICIHAGMCITGPENIEANTSTELMAIVGWCPYFPHESVWCHHPLHGYYQIPLSMSVSELINYTCNYYNRRGLMCSQCQTGYGPAVYAFSLMCAKCSDSGIGWVLYFALTLLPITLFYFVVILFSIKVNTPPLTGFVFMCQTYNFIERLYVDIDMKVVISSQMYTGSNERILRFLVKTVQTLCGFWNLDFFRSVIPPFCVSSHLTIMQALFLEYVYVFYPLLLIVITWMCIELHARNIKPMVILWKPFHKVFVRLQNTWDPTASIVNAFSTFMILYSAKLLFVSSYSIYPTKFYYVKMLPSNFKEKDYREYFDPSIELNSKHYWQYVSCSVSFLMVFLVLPTLLLCLYPIKCFRRLLHHCLPLKWQLILYTFLDTFQGHYKDGTDGTRDYRYFPAVHLILLALIVIFRVHLHFNMYFTLPAQVICMVGSLLFAIARPCKKKHANIIQSLLMALTAFALLTLAPHMSSSNSKHYDYSFLIMLMCMLLPHVVFGGYVIYRIVQRANMKFNISVRKLKSLRHTFCKSVDETMDTLPIIDTSSGQFNKAGLIPSESTALIAKVSSNQ